MFLMYTIKSSSSPMAMPSGMTRVALSSRMRIDASTAPAAVPIATTPVSAAMPSLGRLIGPVAISSTPGSVRNRQGTWKVSTP